MPGGIRCGVRHRIEIHLVRQLGCCSMGKALVVPPQWRTIDLGSQNGCVVVSEGRGHIKAKQSPRYSPISLDATAGLPHSSSMSSFHPSDRFSQFSVLSSTTKSIERSSFPLLSPPHQQTSSSAGFLVWGHPQTHRFFTSRGLGHASRAALSPRVLPELPELGQSWLERQKLCPGCGIEMQDENPKAPGFFQRPAPVKQDQGLEEGEILTDRELLNIVDGEGEVDLEGGRRKEFLEWVETDKSVSPEADLDNDIAFGDGEIRRGRRGAKAKRPGKKIPEALDESGRPVVCARCHALRNYGKVKDEEMENLLPDFDFEHVVGSRLRKAIGRRAVVLMVIDSVDFDGTFPRMAASMLADAERELGKSWQEGKAANVPRLIIVLNKADLLPGQLSPVRLEQWARRRSRAGGVTQISGVHIVSAFKGWGIDKLSKQIIEMAGPRGDVWVIGAQNVGKSSVINALGRLASKGAEGEEGKKRNVFLTEAAIPGTTVGVLKLEGILPGKARVLDTPGLLHPHQITTRLTREEQKMVQIRKVLKPRTFRVKVGHAVTVGGLMRLTVETAPGESIYATIWASPFIPCHMGRTETAHELFDKHIGEKLQPPLSKERVEELGRWVGRSVKVTGDRWDKSSVDVAVAGVGWIALALSGTSKLEIWTYEGVAVTVRDAMVLDLAPVMERPGFTAIKSSVKSKN